MADLRRTLMAMIMSMPAASRKAKSKPQGSPMPSPSYKKLIAGVELPPDEERAALEQIASTDPSSFLQICQLLVNQQRQLRAELNRTREARRELEATLARLMEPPWCPGDVLRVRADGRADVLSGGRRQIVTVAPEITPGDLSPGDEVLLNRELTAVIAKSNEGAGSGAIATVSEIIDGRVILEGGADEKIAAKCDADLAATLKVGDRVTYKPEARWVIEKLSEQKQSGHLLQKPPRVTFGDIGGLDAVIDEIRRDLDLHLVRQKVATAYGLRLMRGITLVGPPGGGKTMLAGAIAHYLAEIRGDAHFLHVKPGSLRGMYYGQTESRIRELFRAARAAPGLVVVFFEELDNFGARGVGIGQDIDGRVLGALLAEIDGLESPNRILCLGATNRLDLCDAALVRPGRFGDRIYTIPRPNREGAREIFAKYLTPDLPYQCENGDSPPAAMIDAAIGYLYGPRATAGPLATITLANGDRHEIGPPAVLSGALIASAVEKAKHAAADRHIDGQGGLSDEDLLIALEETLTAEAQKLRTPAAARRLLDFPEAAEIVGAELPAARRPRRHRYLRAL